MSINPVFNSYPLQTDNIITKKVEFRTRAKRKIESEEIARRMGKKMISEQLQEKVIEISGIILGDSVSDLSSRVDEFHKELSKVEKNLVIEGSRAYTATAERISIPDRSYSQTYVDFDVQFVVAQGFANDNLLTATTLLPSGNLTGNITTTISGTVDNRPLFRFVIPSGINPSSISYLNINNLATGNDLTVSGVWNPGDTIVADFDNFQITKNGTVVDFLGAMDLIETGENTFGLTVSGANNGMNVDIEYRPRYF